MKKIAGGDRLPSSSCIHPSPFLLGRVCTRRHRPDREERRRLSRECRRRRGRRRFRRSCLDQLIFKLAAGCRHGDHWTELTETLRCGSRCPIPRNRNLKEFLPWSRVVNTDLQGKHPRGAAARIVDSPIVRREPRDQHPDHAAPSVVELFKHRCVSGVSVAWPRRSVWMASTAPWPSRGWCESPSPFSADRAVP